MKKDVGLLCIVCGIKFLLLRERREAESAAGSSVTKGSRRQRAYEGLKDGPHHGPHEFIHT